MQSSHPIGIFDSGFGGLTVFKAIKERLPQYDYLYLGDNARAPYGDRSLDIVYEYTLEAVEWMFKMGCPLIILACNTASAEALRKIQMNDLPRMGAEKRVLGVIRPTAEIIGQYTKNKAVGVLGTHGTIESHVYPVEISEFYPDVRVYQHACPMWVPMIENNEHHSAAAAHFVKQDLDKLLQQSEQIDTILLGCTHYPLLMDTIKANLPPGVQVITQGEIVADSLADYLQRHTEIEEQLSREKTVSFYTTDSTTLFDKHGTTFFGEEVHSQHVRL